MNLHRRTIARLASTAAIGVAAVLAPASYALAEPDHQAEADALRDAAQSTGAVVTVQHGDSSQTYASGTTTSGGSEVADAETRLRVASNTKMYVATIVMQLVEEGGIDLDASIATYLPGLVVGEGIDENAITVRQLLQHTAGLGDYYEPAVIYDPKYQWFPPTPEDMIKVGLSRGSQFAPGTDWAYSNPGYVILGQLVEKVTGQRIGDAIQERIAEPLGLEETTYAYAGEKEIDGPHFAGYLGSPPLVYEVTGHEPGLWSSAGALISSGSDMTVFINALIGGDLVGEDSLAQMQTTVDTGLELTPRYGLGLLTMETSCGTVWGHTGHLVGFSVYTFTNGEGDAVFAGANTVAHPDEQVEAVVDSALCGSPATENTRSSKTSVVESQQVPTR